MISAISSMYCPCICEIVPRDMAVGVAPGRWGHSDAPLYILYGESLVE
jgi:hypothetical protein